MTVRTGNTPARRAVLTRRVRLLVAATISYNVIEAIVAIAAGSSASSTALIGFGLDSVIEVSSAAAVAWQFSARDHAVREARERRTLRIIAVSFFALAIYVTVEAIRTLTGGHPAGESMPGIVLAALSLLIMPLLSWAQRRNGRELGSATAVADSKQTLMCTYLSAALLVGLVANAVLGWAWADPAVSLLIAAVAVKEGREAWHGDNCCAPPVSSPRQPARRTPTTAPQMTAVITTDTRAARRVDETYAIDVRARTGGPAPVTRSFTPALAQDSAPGRRSTGRTASPSDSSTRRHTLTGAVRFTAPAQPGEPVRSQR